MNTIIAILLIILSFFVGMLIGVHPKVYLLHQQITENLGWRFGK